MLLTLWPQMSGIRKVVCCSHLLGYIVLFLTSSKKYNDLEQNRKQVSWKLTLFNKFGLMLIL